MNVTASTGSSAAPGWWPGWWKVTAPSAASARSAPVLPVGSQPSSSRQPPPTPGGPSNEVKVGAGGTGTSGEAGDPVVEPCQQHPRSHLRRLGQDLRPLVTVGRRPRRLVDQRDREEVLPRAVHRPRAFGKRFDVREGAGAEVPVVPAADREDRDRDRPQQVDERPVAPELVERRGCRGSRRTPHRRRPRRRWSGWRCRASCRSRPARST